MASKDDDDIDIYVAVGKAIDYYSEGLRRKIMDLDRKIEEIDDAKKRLNEISIQLNEISIQYHDCKTTDEADILNKRLNVLIAEFRKIKDRIDPDLKVHCGTGGHSQEEGCKADDVKNEFLDKTTKSDSSDGPDEQPESTDNEGIEE